MASFKIECSKTYHWLTMKSSTKITDEEIELFENEDDLRDYIEGLSDGPRDYDLKSNGWTYESSGDSDYESNINEIIEPILARWRELKGI